MSLSNGDKKDIEAEHVDQALDTGDITEALDEQKSLTLSQSWRIYRKAMIWSVIVSTCIIMESYDTMLIGTFFAYPTFQQRFGERLANGTYSIPAEWQTLLGLSPTVGIIIGIFLNGFLIDRFGHRKVCLVSLVLLTGLFGLTVGATSKEMLLASQLLCGVPWGCLNTAAPSYAVETAPLALRHYASAFVNLSWVIGHIIGAGILNGTVTIPGDLGWKIPFMLQWIWPLPLFIAILFAPDSPWWLVRRGKTPEAIRALTRLSDPSVDNETYVRVIAHTIEMEDRLNTGSTYAACFRGTNRRRTEIAVIAWTAQNLVGFAMQANQIYFFTLAGLASTDSFKLGLGTYCIAFVGTAGSMYLMSYIGRRVMWLSGLCFMFVMMATIGVLGCIGQTGPVKWAQAILLLIWFFGYGFSTGPIPFVIASEISSAHLRQKTISLARGIYYMTLIVNSIVAPYMLNPTKGDLKGKAAFPAAGFILILTIWSFFRLPETKGRTFEELNIMFEKRLPARDFAAHQVQAADHDLANPAQAVKDSMSRKAVQ